jgi:hypothetical protein
MRVQCKIAVKRKSSLRRKLYLCVTALGCPNLLSNTVAALSSTSWYTMLFENANLGDIRRSTTGIFYQQGDEGESETRLREHTAAALLYTSKFRATDHYDSILNQSSSSSSSGSPIVRVISWATKCCKPKDEYEMYMEFLGHRHHRLHDECIVYDDHCPSMTSAKQPLTRADNRQTTSPIIQRMYRISEKQRQVLGRLRHVFTPLIKSVIWMGAQSSVLLDLQSTIPVTLAIVVVLLFRPICVAAASTLATRK